MKKPFDTLFGYVEYSLRGENYERLLVELANKGVSVRDVRPSEGGILFKSDLLCAVTVEEQAEVLKLKLSVLDKGGFPYLLWLQRKRFGLFVGAAIIVSFIVFMSSFIFSMEIYGNITLYTHEIEEALAKYGFYIGAPVASQDFDELRRCLMREFNKIAYVTIYIRGSHAEVEITERNLPPPDKNLKMPCNITASDTGQILTIETYEGEALVEKWQAVKKGQLLVSGVLYSKYIGFRTVHASAMVLARTKQSIKLTQPLYSTETVETGKTEEYVYIDFFGLRIPFFGNAVSAFSDYDEKSETVILSIGKDVKLPVSMTKILRNEFSQHPVLYTEEEAKQRLSSRLAELERLSFTGMTIEEKEPVFLFDGKTVTLNSVYTVIKDIAETKEIYRSLP